MVGKKTDTKRKRRPLIDCDYRNMKNKEKRILFLISSLGGGGAERVICRVASELSKKHHVYLLYNEHKPHTYCIDPAVHLLACLTRKTAVDNIIVRWLFGKYNVLRRLVMVTAVRYKYNIDTTVSFLRGPNILNVMAGGKCRKIVSERNDPSCKDEYYRKRALFVNQRADYVVFQTRRVQEMYPEDIRRKSSVIVNPTEVSCMAADVKTKKIVTVGRLHEQKNQKMLLKAFSLYHKSHPGYHLYFYGEGELLQELMQVARNYNLSRCVHFEGFKENIHEAIADAEQFVLSSDYEGLPNALMEAMMMGLACISTACNGSEVLIDHEQNGLLVPVGDAEALGKAMCRLSDDPGLRDRLRKAAVLSAQEWKTERVVRLWERIL